MKTIITSIFACALCALCISFSSTNSPMISIEDAIKQGLVKVKLVGKGGHSGSCLTMEIQNLKSKEMNLFVEAGRRLNSNDDTEQDLLVVKDQMITLKGGTKKKMDVSGFCCQLSNHSPKTGSGFSLGTTADEKLVQLAKFLNGKPFPDHIIQEAVWCISDKENPSNLAVEEENANAELHKSVKELRKFVCGLLGVEDKWYSTPQKRIETPEREIQANPVEIYGAINYEVKSATIINSELQDENHKVIFKMPGKNTMGKGTWDYKFHLKLDGFARGTYHVILKAGTTQIMDKEFTI